MSLLQTQRLFPRVLPNKLFYVQVSQLHTSHVLEKYPNWKMIKDVKIRKTIKEHAFERMNINAMRKNQIIPPELQAICDREIAAFPTDACVTKSHDRCIITSRARGLVPRWRLSRIAWRLEADYNKLSGVQRAMW